MVRFALTHAIINNVRIHIRDDQQHDAIIHLPIDKVTPLFRDHERVDVVYRRDTPILNLKRARVVDEQGNHVAWNLVYVQQLPSLNPSLVTISATEEMNWYAHMPSAVVYGAIIVNNETIVVDSARGYHDHDWGPWKLTDTLWNWFETNTPEYAIVGYDLFALNTGQILMELAGQTVQFENSQYRIFNSGWTTLYGLPFTFPTKTTVVANNGEYILTLNIEIETTGYVAKPEQDLVWVMLESDATFKGQLISHGVVQQIESVGFREYTVNIPNQ